VYGGGDTAMDAARVARRLGAEDAVIVYRRTRAQMPAHPDEVFEAEREGIRMNWLRTIQAFDGPDLTVEVMELDDAGRPVPTGRTEKLAADSVVLALGQRADTAFLRGIPGVEFTADGTVVVSPSLMTGFPGVFAGGDMVPAERTVTVAVGHGRTAARHIDAYLRDEAVMNEPRPRMAGFVLGSVPLIIAGGLVGAAGAILTKLMADAMNRKIIAIVMGVHGTGDAVAVPAGSGSASVREISADDAAIQLAYAGKIVIVPGYGLAAAQAQHEAVALAKALTERGVDVSYGIHPVAGRRPGHMNVLLAEADAPYEQLKDLEEINPAFPGTDVVLVVGANDVTNPAARRPGNPVSGMPILDVDKARSVIVIKRSLGHGYAGIDNELYTDPRTAMLFADAKAGLQALVTGLHAYAA
jgi:hypothetical protein